MIAANDIVADRESQPPDGGVDAKMSAAEEQVVCSVLETLIPGFEIGSPPVEPALVDQAVRGEKRRIVGVGTCC